MALEMEKMQKLVLSPGPLLLDGAQSVRHPELGF